MRRKIKICGLFREEDIIYVNELLPDYAGFIINFPKSHRNLDFDKSKELILKLNSKIKSVCVFVNSPAEFIIQFDFADIIQLHGDEDNNFIEKLREKLPPNKEIWKAFKIKSIEDLEIAEKSVADKIILDNGYGTGEKFDWSLLKNFKREFILAGGIDEKNIANIEITPTAFDVSSGVETDQKKDYNKIKKIIEIVRRDENEQC